MAEQKTDRKPQTLTTTTTTTTTTTIAMSRDGRLQLLGDTRAGGVDAAVSGEAAEGMTPLVMITTQTVTQSSGGSGTGNPPTDPKGPSAVDVPLAQDSGGSGTGSPPTDPKGPSGGAVHLAQDSGGSGTGNPPTDPKGPSGATVPVE